MTTELTEPQSELGSAPANGSEPVQAPGHRRRRRRRKNKSSQAAGAAPQPQMQPLPAQPQAQTPPQPAPQRPAKQRKRTSSAAEGRRQGGPGQNQNQNQNQGKRRKPFQAGSSGAQPGNSVSSGQQGKRKSGGRQQKGPREFVGPMDHSYRVANGNIADGPPSTIQVTSNGHNGYYQEAYVPPAVPVRADAPTRIFCFVEDLFFLAKIQETARKLGVKVEFIKGADKDAIARITELPEAERPKLLLFDLNNLNAKPITLIPKIKAKLKKATSIVGFLNHLQGELKAKAVEAGCDSVMPRSAFSQTLPNLLRRYGMEEEEEYAQQPM